MIDGECTMVCQWRITEIVGDVCSSYHWDMIDHNAMCTKLLDWCFWYWFHSCCQHCFKNTHDHTNHAKIWTESTFESTLLTYPPERFIAVKCYALCFRITTSSIMTYSTYLRISMDKDQRSHREATKLPWAWYNLNKGDACLRIQSFSNRSLTSRGLTMKAWT